ncbi:hypothetical protein HY990_05815 [Candidatus Micrarchaeota archaeon]|nr:hypothetical protein [Candidatus Micrarchaeota archaeon]
MILQGEIEEDIKRIRERNARVELDKAWETSFERRGVIALGTYLGALILLTIIKAENAALGATIPMFGYLSSTLTLPFLKEHWAKKYTKMNKNR